MTRRFVAEMAELARAEGFEGHEFEVVEAWVFWQVEAGCSVYSIWKQLEDPEKWKHPERLFYAWLNARSANPEGKEGPGGRRARYREAQRVGALATADRSETVFEPLVGADGRAGVGVTSTDVQLADRRSRIRQKLASQRDPERYGEQRAAGTVVNIGSLHLEALRGAAGRAELGGREPLGIEGEVVEVEGGDGWDED